MEFTSIAEILNFAISKEKASVRFYQDLLAQVVQPATQSLFEVLIQKEQEHIDALQLELTKCGYTVYTDKGKLDSKFLWNEQIENDDPIRNLSFVDALMLAIQKERASFRLYAQLLGSARDKQFAKIIMELAEEEMRHVLQLEEEYKAIIHHED